MFDCSSLVLLAGALCACSNAFFLSWGSPETQHQEAYPPVNTYYHRRYLQPHQGNEGQPVQIPAIPIQVPLQAHLSPTNNIHNVQLVPCLCPVSPEYDYDRTPIDGTQIKTPPAQN